MSTTSFAAPRARSHTRRWAVAAATAFLVSVLAIPSGPAAADGSRVVVREGESIQAAIDAAEPGTTIVVRGDHVENVWVDKSGIHLIGRNATITPPPEGERAENPCSGGDESGPNPDFATTICVHPPTDDFPEFPEFPSDDLFLNDITVRGFNLPDAAFDAIAVFFTRDVQIERNTTTNPGCDGIFVLFSSNFNVNRNTANGSAFCSGIEVAASEHGAIRRNETHDNDQNGIIANDTSYVAIERNTATGSCYGINVGDPPDFFDIPSSNVWIKRNTANGNNSSCFPFGPDFPLGVTGILVVGASDVHIERNTANDNVSDAPSITAGGIAVFDWPGELPTDPPSAVADNVVVINNRAQGNSSAAGAVDLNLMTVGTGLAVYDNRCGVGVSAAGPEPTWCRR